MARIALLFVLTAGLASGLAVRAADAAILRVAAGAADVLATDGICSLREAIENANDDAATWPDCPAGSGPDEIRLPAGSYLLASTGLALSDEVTVIGAGPDATVIDASGIAGGALSLSADAAIRGLTIQDAPDDGIYATARLTLAESRIAGSGGVGLSVVVYDGDVVITDCEITGNAAGGLLLFPLSATSTAWVSNSTVSGNGGAPHPSGGFSFGGINILDGNLSITNSAITANGARLSGTRVGGIDHYGGVVTLTNVTVSGNEGISAGGIRVHGAVLSAKVDVTHSTIFGNTGVGILLHCVQYCPPYPGVCGDCVPAELDLSHTIVAGNSPDNCDLYDGYSEYGGFNLDDDGTCDLNDPSDLYADPMLGPLQDNGGPTLTHALLPGSPAIDAIPVADCTYDDDGDPLTPEVPLTEDQRGVARPQGEGCDIGAYEVTACADGLDNDGDGLVDYPEDPGCWDAASLREDPQCQDGINNDPGQDGLIDFDGGLSVLGYAATDPDPQCVGKPWKDKERKPAYACGLGAELALVLPPLIWLRRRRRGSRSATARPAVEGGYRLAGSPRPFCA